MVVVSSAQPSDATKRRPLSHGNASARLRRGLRQTIPRGRPYRQQL